MASIKLKQVTIEKYKSIQKQQIVEIDDAITTLVGMNEAGKTSFLTAIAKTNYFTTDKDFEFDITQDYPRNELIDFQHEEEDCDIIKCKYEISQELLLEIENELGKDIFKTTEFTRANAYFLK
jgi:predicted ATP-dependent endonuclease of OLD family